MAAWASWQLLGWALAGVAGLMLLGRLASTLVLWWDAGGITAARAEKARLRSGTAGKSRAARRLELCNPGNRPCVRVNEAAGAFESQGRNDYRVIQGY